MAWTKSMRIALHRRLIHFGIDTRKLRKDRILLEQTIFPYLSQSDAYQRILFVGTAWYNLHYPRLFQNKEFWTLEIDPKLARFGSPKHIIDSCTNIDRHFDENSLDCIILNGVFGFGLNDPTDMEQTCFTIHKSLRPNGLLLLGYNTLPDSTPCPIDHIQALKLFTPFIFPPLNTHTLQSDPTNQHWFQFLSKPTRI